MAKKSKKNSLPQPPEAPTAPESRNPLGEKFVFLSPEAKSAGSGTVTKPLAAYRLGHHSYALRSKQSWFWKHASPGYAEMELRGILRAIGQTLVALADEANPGVLGELRQAVDATAQVTAAMVHALRESIPHGPWWLGKGPVPGEDEWLGLRSLADRLLERTSRLKKWYDLGSAIGRSRLLNSQARESQTLPDMQPVIDAFRSFSRQDLQAVPDLRSLVDAQGHPEIMRPAGLLKQPLGEPAVIPGDPVNTGPEAGVVAANKWLSTLHDRVQEILSRYSPTAGQSGVRRGAAKSQRPRWDRQRRELWLGDKLVRKFHPKAKNLLPILDAFHKAKWATHIDAPLTEEEKVMPVHSRRPDQQRLHETLKSLNSGIEEGTIRFRADGTGRGIIYDILA